MNRMRCLAPYCLTICLAIVLALTGRIAQAENRVFHIPSRPQVETSIFWQARDGATATVLLFPGGAGGYGKVEDGKPGSNNFLVRSVPHFLAAGFNVAIFGRPSDTADLDYPDRISPQHMRDARAALDFVKAHSAAPVWIVGTSRGSVSAAAMAIQIHDPAIAGLVLSSSIVNREKAGALPTQDLAAITLPVLLLHHAKDACRLCRPDQVPALLDALKNAPFKKLRMVSGGADPSGDPCHALHWHGFIGMEQEAVQDIAAWIRQPSN